MDHAKNLIEAGSLVKEDDKSQQITKEISEGLEVNSSITIPTTLTMKKEKTKKFKLWRSIPKSPKSELKKSKASSLFSSSFKGLVGPENMKLNLDCPEIDNESMRILGEFLKRMRSLERLSFDFSCAYPAEKGLEALIKPLKDQLCLKEICLDLKCYGSPIGDLMKSFQSWRSLEKISLNLYGCAVNDLNLAALSEGLENLERPLKNLFLNFGFVGPVTERGVQVLCQGIEKHTSLQNLELIFSGCIEIDNRGLCYLGESLPKISQLKTLNLGFDSCFDLNDTGLRDLGKGLETLSALQSLSVNFYSCNMTDEGLKSLNYNLQELTELTKIDCDFEKCTKITPKALEDFELNMQSLITRNK